MSQHARSAPHSHRRPRRRSRHRARSQQRVLLVLAATATAATAGAGTLLGSAGDAAAAQAPSETLPTTAVTHGLTTLGEATGYAVGPALDLQLDPLANTSTDPLTNSAGTRIADFPPITTAALTGPITDGASTRDLAEALLGGLLGGGSPS